MADCSSFFRCNSPDCFIIPSVTLLIPAATAQWDIKSPLHNALLSCILKQQYCCLFGNNFFTLVYSCCSNSLVWFPASFSGELFIFLRSHQQCVYCLLQNEMRNFCFLYTREKQNHEIMLFFLTVSAALNVKCNSFL